MIAQTDIDIDLADRQQLLSIVPHVAAMQKDGFKKRKHNTGVYFHEVPQDPFTQLCTLDYQTAEQVGYFKMDILNVGLYKEVKDPEHLDRLANAEPMWTLLEQPEVVKDLFHLGNHSDITCRMRPKSLEELAMLLAIIRPGKKHLQGKTWDEIRSEVWIKPDDETYYFKKSHSFGYALAIVVQLNLICEQAGIII